MRSVPVLAAVVCVTVASAQLQVVARPAASGPQTACPCSAYGPYPCAAVTLVALAHQADALGLTSAQAAEVSRLRSVHLSMAHDVLADLQALRGALHDLDWPFQLDDTFALLYDVGRHEAELNETFHIAERALLDVLNDTQRARWNALVAEAAALQETVPECTDDVLSP